MQVYIVKITTPKFHVIFGSWRDEMQVQAWIKTVQDLQAEDYNDMGDANGVKEYYNKVREYLTPFLCKESQQMFLKHWDDSELEALLDLFINPRLFIQTFEIHDDYYQESVDNRMKRNAGL